MLQTIAEILAVMLPIAGVFGGILFYFAKKFLGTFEVALQELKESNKNLTEKLQEVTENFAELLGEHRVNHKG